MDSLEFYERLKRDAEIIRKRAEFRKKNGDSVTFENGILKGTGTLPDGTKIHYEIDHTTPAPVLENDNDQSDYSYLEDHRPFNATPEMLGY